MPLLYYYQAQGQKTMAQKISQKIKDASDNMVRRFTSPKTEFGDVEYAASDENYDLVIEELDYVNKHIAEMDGDTDLQTNNTPEHQDTSTDETLKRSQWKTATELKEYFPETLRSEIIKKLCELQPTMPDKIIKIGNQMALHTDAVPEFAQKTGLKIITKTKSATAKKIKKSKKQITDMDNVVYIIGRQNKSVEMD